MKKHNTNDFSRETLKQPQHASVFTPVLGTAVLPTNLWFASTQSHSPQLWCRVTPIHTHSSCPVGKGCSALMSHPWEHTAQHGVIERVLM